MKQKKTRKTRVKRVPDFTFLQARENHTTGGVFTLYCFVTERKAWYDVMIHFSPSAGRPEALIRRRFTPPLQKHTKPV